jgi:hypothetical protein
MKKLLPFLAILGFNLHFLTASMVGNLADPALLEEGLWISDLSWSNLRLGMSGDIVFDKRMRSSRETRGISHPELNWQLFVTDLGWNVKERFDLHLLVGPVTKVNMCWRREGALTEASGNQGLFWGASSKLILLEVEDTTLGVDFHGGGIAWIKGALVQNGLPLPKSFSSNLHFWQIAAGLSQHIGSFRPYVGGVVDHLVYHIENLRFKNLVAVGLVEGCSFSFGSCIFLNLEVRQFFESGLSLSGELRF